MCSSHYKTDVVGQLKLVAFDIIVYVTGGDSCLGYM